jgi:L-2-hydroxyglutarate oxidase LhgO
MAPRILPELIRLFTIERPASIAAMSDSVDTVVIGAGAIGLAVARAVAMTGRDVIVVERHRRIGEETSSRNSGVIHSGIYYPAGSLKAKLCVRGRELLTRYCEERAVAHSRIGKLVVAQADQLDALRLLRDKGLANGVHDLQLLSDIEVRGLEPALRSAAGLLSPATGIVDVHEYMTALWGDLEAAGGVVAFQAELMHAAPCDGGLVATIRSGEEESSMQCRQLINAAGLHAARLADRIEGYPQHLRRTAFFAKGNYFALRGKSPFRRLVYPMPGIAGLGIHATLDLGGALRFGPDVEWVEELDFAVDARRAGIFYEAIRQYWPELPDDSLQPAYAGIRPKLVGANATTAADFVIEDASVHSVPGLVNLLGFESPGLTASLAVGELVARHTSPSS